MSRLPFELLLAIRYLRPRRTFVSIITVISIIGVALGVAVLIIVISVLSGFGYNLRQEILGFNAPLEIRGLGGRPVSHYEDLVRVVSSNKSVTGVAPFVLGPVLLQSDATTGGGQIFATPILRSVDVNAEASGSVLPQTIVPGGSVDMSGHAVVVGGVLAEHYGLNVGDHVSIYSPDELRKMADELQHGGTNVEAAFHDDYTVSGIVDASYFIETSLGNAQDLFDLKDSVHGLSVKIRDPFRAPEVKQEFQDTLGHHFKITTWEEQNSAFLGALGVEKSMMYFIMFFIVVVASFGITCTLITFIVMKTREIGLMKAVGASNSQVMFVFVFQSVVISIIGVALGLALGLVALYFRNGFLDFMNRLTGWQLFSPSADGLIKLPAVIAPTDLIIICGGSFAICLLAAILPARYAGRRNTVEALRYE